MYGVCFDCGPILGDVCVSDCLPPPFCSGARMVVYFFERLSNVFIFVSVVLCARVIKLELMFLTQRIQIRGLARRSSFNLWEGSLVSCHIKYSYSYGTFVNFNHVSTSLMLSTVTLSQHYIRHSVRYVPC